MRPGIGLSLVLALAPACAAPVREVRQEPAEGDPDAHYRSEFFARKGVSLGVRGTGSHLGGDFDGDTTLDGPDTIFLSDTEDALGYELVLGFVGAGSAVELSYARTEYEGEFAGFPGDVEYKAFTVRGVNYWRANSAVQPLAFVGFLLPLADIEDGSSDGVDTGNGKLRSGFGLELGGGLAWRLTPRLALDLRASTVYQEFERAEGVADDAEDIDDGVSAPSFSLSIGLAWTVGGKR